jgi:hypothetical protein
VFDTRGDPAASAPVSISDRHGDREPPRYPGTERYCAVVRPRSSLSVEVAGERWITRHLASEVDRPPLQDVLAVVRQLMDQDLEPDRDRGGMRIREGTAEDRRISVEDGEIRHGRRSKTKRIDGYKRHIASDLDSQAILAGAVTQANQPEHEALALLKVDLDAQAIGFRDAHFDRGYMGATLDDLDNDGAIIVCKPWRAHNTPNEAMYHKQDFVIDLRLMTINCPVGQTGPIKLGQTIYFDARACDRCRLRHQCTTAKPGTGRSVSIADDDSRQENLRRLVITKSGRQRFRERVPVEHRLAHIGHRQSNHARYCQGTDRIDGVEHSVLPRLDLVVEADRDARDQTEVALARWSRRRRDRPPDDPLGSPGFLAVQAVRVRWRAGAATVAGNIPQPPVPLEALARLSLRGRAAEGQRPSFAGCHHRSRLSEPRSWARSPGVAVAPAVVPSLHSTTPWTLQEVACSSLCAPSLWRRAVQSATMALF